jgi:hypothetical protein
MRSSRVLRSHVSGVSNGDGGDRGGDDSKKDTDKIDKKGKKGKKVKKGKKKVSKAERTTSGKTRTSKTVSDALYTWTVASKDTVNTSPLKLKLKKIPKAPSPAESSKNAKLLQIIKSVKIKKTDVSPQAIKLNTKKNKNLLITNNTEGSNTGTAYVGRPQPYNALPNSELAASSSDDVVISGKTGQRITKGSGGKLFPLKGIKI